MIYNSIKEIFDKHNQCPICFGILKNIIIFYNSEDGSSIKGDLNNEYDFASPKSLNVREIFSQNELPIEIIYSPKDILFDNLFIEIKCITPDVNHFKKMIKLPIESSSTSKKINKIEDQFVLIRFPINGGYVNVDLHYSSNKSYIQIMRYEEKWGITLHVMQFKKKFNFIILPDISSKEIILDKFNKVLTLL